MNVTRLSFVFFTLIVSSLSLKLYGSVVQSQREGNQISYHLDISYQTINPAGKDVQAMLINEILPGPNLYFNEGDKASIYVTNKMDQETSLHWHGILLPNFQDGVPYLTSPPIKPGQTYKFEFILKHSGTYWYHSHTGLQEQRGIYGGIVVQPKKKRYHYNHDLVLNLSDWSNEHPNSIMRNLKRGSEWYSIKKGLVQSLDRVIKEKALIPQIQMWWQRMPGMDISDVYYEAFLLNGKRRQNYTQFKAGETIRVRWINSSASTYFWLSLGGLMPKLISVDGVDIQPVKGNHLLHAIGETYDFLLTIPKARSIELKAVAQDGSGEVTAILGKGPLLKAASIPRYHPIKSMKNMKHGHHKMLSQGKSHLGHQKTSSHAIKKISKSKHVKSQLVNSKNLKRITYDHLKAFSQTNFSKHKTVKELNLNLTGSMWRYIWSINGKVLSESSVIPIQKDQVLRLRLHNKTMMHHPMHLHGHFFRVLNKNGDYSPLKHTVDVPPMESVVLEFVSKEPGDWFFHCHVLYHMKGGMARIFRYGHQRDKRMKDYPLSFVMDMDKKWNVFADWKILSNHSDLSVEFSNTRNEFSVEGLFAWLDKNYKKQWYWQSKFSYERFLSDYFRPYLELSMESSKEDIFAIEKKAELGFRYLLPLLVDFELSIDRKFKIGIELDYELLLFPRLEFFVEWDWTGDFGWLEDLPKNQVLISDYEWVVGLEYTVSQNFFLTGFYETDWGWVGGAQLNF